MTRLKVMTVLGTRPEIIRLSRVMARLDEHTDHSIVHTGQNWDYELNELFFNELKVRRPDHFLEVETSSLGTVIGGILVSIERVLKDTRPDAMLVLGDTNSALAAIMARRMKIPVYHMEAGNRSFDQNVPEETNRRLVDHISDFNLAYTEHARRHLLDEGLPHRRVYVTGSPMREVLDHHREEIERSDILERLELKSRGYFIVSVHREENVDSKDRLRSFADTLNTLAREYEMPIIVSTHPRTRSRLDQLEDFEHDPRVRYLKPFGFYDYNFLQSRSYCAISDSGTIAEESAILDFPAITPRDAIERPEAIDTGNIVFTGLQREAILESISAVVQMRSARPDGVVPAMPDEYRITNVSERVVKLILGSARLSNQWDGIRRHDYT